jgi:hypothetical protein
VVWQWGQRIEEEVWNPLAVQVDDDDDDDTYDDNDE